MSFVYFKAFHYLHGKKARVEEGCYRKESKGLSCPFNTCIICSNGIREEEGFFFRKKPYMNDSLFVPFKIKPVLNLGFPLPPCIHCINCFLSSSYVFPCCILLWKMRSLFLLLILQVPELILSFLGVNTSRGTLTAGIPSASNAMVC